MPRFRRQTAFGSVQHVISRFVDREYRFDAPGARRNYLSRVGTALTRTDWRVLGFALMSSHVHWVLIAGTRPSASLIKPLHVGFSAWLNKIEGRIGPVFADRHRNITCRAPTASVLLSYVHNNPVRGGVVEDPSDSSWTSHRAYLGEAAAPAWLDVQAGLELCGFELTDSGRDAFHKFALARAREGRSIELSGGDLNARRRQMRVEHNGPVEIESPQLGERRGALEVTTPVFVPPACKVRTPWQGEPLSLLLAVEQLTGVSPFELCSRNRSQRVVGARRLAALTWSLYLHRSSAEIARALGVTSSSAAEMIATADAALHERAAIAADSLQTDTPIVGAARSSLSFGPQQKAVSELPRTVP